ATFEGMSPQGLVTDRLVEFHRPVARGGAGMTTVAYLAVSAEGRSAPGEIVLRPEAVAGLGRLTDAVHEHGAAAAAQPGRARPGDRWGGSLENRARFRRQVVRAVRDAVGDSVAVTAKFNMADGVRGGLWPDESIEIARMLEEDGALHAMELTGGSSFANPMYL